MSSHNDYHPLYSIVVTFAQMQFPSFLARHWYIAYIEIFTKICASSIDYG